MAYEIETDVGFQQEEKCVMAYEIETDVEMPIRRRDRKYPLEDLTVGESFFIEGQMKRLNLPKRLKPRKFRQAVMNKNGVGSAMGLRIKRVS